MVNKIKELDVEDIESLLYDTKNFLDLKKELENIGYNFSSGKKGLAEAYEVAMKYWNEYREHYLPLDSIPLKEPDYLPGSYLENSCNTLKIVGIFHGVNGKGFKNFYESKIATIAENNDYKIYYESGFEKTYIPKNILKKRLRVISFYDHTLLTFSDLLKLLFQYVINFNVMRFVYKLKIHSFISSEIDKKILWIDNKISSGKNSEKYLLLARELGKRIKLPPHHSITYFSLIGGTYRKVMARRSIYMSEILLGDFLYSDCLNLYALVGQGHEGEIEYMIRKWIGEYESPRDLVYLEFEK